MECVLQGVIESRHVNALEQLVLGMTGAQPRPIFTHEQIFQNIRIIGPGPCELRLSCTLNAANKSWRVIHEGGAMRGAEADRLPAQVRSVVRAEASACVQQLIPAMGMRLENEFLRRGSSLSFRHLGSILMLSVVEILPPTAESEGSKESNVVPIGEGDSVSYFAPVSDLHLVELSAPATAENYASVASILQSFAEMLSSILTLSKPGVPAGIPPTAVAAASAIAPAVV